MAVLVSFMRVLPVEQNKSAGPATWLQAMRLNGQASRQRNVNTHDGVDDYMATQFRVDTYHTQNLECLDHAYDFDEFGDIDNEYEGLTIIEPMGEVATFDFLTGYDIL